MSIYLNVDTFKRYLLAFESLILEQITDNMLNILPHILKVFVTLKTNDKKNNVLQHIVVTIKNTLIYRNQQ